MNEWSALLFLVSINFIQTKSCGICYLHPFQLTSLLNVVFSLKADLSITCIAFSLSQLQWSSIPFLLCPFIFWQSPVEFVSSVPLSVYRFITCEWSAMLSFLAKLWNLLLQSLSQLTESITCKSSGLVTLVEFVTSVPLSVDKSIACWQNLVEFSFICKG